MSAADSRSARRCGRRGVGSCAWLCRLVDLPGPDARDRNHYPGAVAPLLIGLIIPQTETRRKVARAAGAQGRRLRRKREPDARHADQRRAYRLFFGPRERARSLVATARLEKRKDPPTARPVASTAGAVCGTAVSVTRRRTPAPCVARVTACQVLCFLSHFQLVSVKNFTFKTTFGYTSMLSEPSIRPVKESSSL